KGASAGGIGASPAPTELQLVAAPQPVEEVVAVEVPGVHGAREAAGVGSAAGDPGHVVDDEGDAVVALRGEGEAGRVVGSLAGEEEAGAEDVVPLQLAEAVGLAGVEVALVPERPL